MSSRYPQSSQRLDQHPAFGCAGRLLSCRETGLKKWIALGFSLVTFLLSLLLWVGWQNGFAGMQFEQIVHAHSRIEPAPITWASTASASFWCC